MILPYSIPVSLDTKDLPEGAQWFPLEVLHWLQTPKNERGVFNPTVVVLPLSATLDSIEQAHSMGVDVVKVDMQILKDICYLFEINTNPSSSDIVGYGSRLLSRLFRVADDTPDVLEINVDATIHAIESELSVELALYIREWLLKLTVGYSKVHEACQILSGVHIRGKVDTKPPQREFIVRDMPTYSLSNFDAISPSTATLDEVVPF